MTALDINFASNILTSIMSCTLTNITSHFMFPIDPVREKLKGYNLIIKEPICLNEMMHKMRSEEYQSIKEFVCDFRLMLFNFYRYFGCDSKMGKCAAKLEAMFEQKLLLLPIDIRVKTSMDAILADDENTDTIGYGMGRRRCGDRSYNNDIRMVTPIKAMMDEMENCGTISAIFSDNAEFQSDPMNFLTERLQKWQEKRRNLMLIRGFDDWYAINTTDYDRHVLDTCSEFVEFLQFISLGYYAIGLDELLMDSIKLDYITPEDVQYAILFPCSSRILAAIVTLLITKSKNRIIAMKGPLSEYNQWNKELAERVSFIYKQWLEKRMCDTPNLFIKRFNIEPTFFKVLGQRRSPLSSRQFHELTVYQRCHLLLAMCSMVLRNEYNVHNAIEKSIEWEDHQRIVLSRIGNFEYVRFSGLGEYSSFYIYRMKALEIEEELSLYSPQIVIPVTKRKRNQQPDKYRMPKWHASEVRKFKSKKANVAVGHSKKKAPLIVSESDTLIRPLPVDISKICDDIFTDINEDSGNKYASDIDTSKVDTNQSGPTSVTTNDDDRDEIDTNDNEPGLLVEYHDIEEEEVPEIFEPVDGELQLLAKDLLGVTNLVKDIKEKMESGSEEEIEGYKILMAKLVDIQKYFEEIESMRLAKLNECRLRLRREVAEMEGRVKVDGLLEGCPELVEEDVSDDESSREYEESERGVKRKWNDRSDMSVNGDSASKKSRLTVHPFKNSSENCVPVDKGPVIGPDGFKVKRKVFQIYNDYFTDELIPVKVKEDGSLESLPLDSVTEERYALARKMIDLYKHKYGISTTGNGLRSVSVGSAVRDTQ